MSAEHARDEARYRVARLGALEHPLYADDRVVYFKQIRPVRLPDTCAGCQFNNDQDCEEGFYGVRLYYGQDGVFRVGVCIQRMDLCLTLDEFLTSPYVGEIRRLRQREWERLAAQQAG